MNKIYAVEMMTFLNVDTSKCTIAVPWWYD